MPILHLTRGEQIPVNYDEGQVLKKMLLLPEEDKPKFAEVRGEPIKVARMERVSFDEEHNRAVFGRDPGQQEKEIDEVRKGWNAFMKQSADEKAKFWFRFIFGTRYFLVAGFGREGKTSDEAYKELKERVGKAKMAKITHFIRKWYSENTDARWPDFEEYKHFLPNAPAKASGADGWSHILNGYTSDRVTPKH